MKLIQFLKKSKRIMVIMATGLVTLSALVATTVSTMAWFSHLNPSLTGGVESGSPDLTVKTVTAYKEVNGLLTPATVAVTDDQGNQDDPDTTFDVPTDGAGYYLVPDTSETSIPHFKYADNSGVEKFVEYSQDINLCYLEGVTLSVGQYQIRQYQFVNSETYNAPYDFTGENKLFGDSVTANESYTSIEVSTAGTYDIWFDHEQETVRFTRTASFVEENPIIEENVSTLQTDVTSKTRKSGQGPKRASKPSKLYLYVNNEDAGADYFAYMWKGGSNASDKMTLVHTWNTTEKLFSVNFNASHDSVIFIRMQGGSSSFDWDNNWGKTGDLSVPDVVGNKTSVYCTNISSLGSGSWNDWFAAGSNYYFKPSYEWKNNTSNVRFAALFCNGSSDTWVNATEVGSGGYYKIPAPNSGTWKNMTIYRMKGDDPTNSFSNPPCWNQTADLTPGSGTLWTMTATTSGDWDNGGSWGNLPTYTITAASGGNGSASGTKTVDLDASVTLTASANSHYHFVKWTDGSGSQVSTNASYTVNNVWQNATYTANFAIDTHTITATGSNGTVSIVKKIGGASVSSGDSVDYGTVVVLTATPNTGYEFTKWSDEITSATREVTVNSNVSLTATFSKVTYTLSYDLDGGSVESANPETYDVTSSAITLNNPTRTGYTFKGWSGTGLDGDSNTSVTIAAGSTGNRSYTANWTANKYNVSFYANYPNDATSTTTLIETKSNQAFGSNYTLPASNPSFSGWTFTGWNTEANGSGTTVTGSTPIATASNHNVYAIWQQCWTITFNNNGGSGSHVFYQPKTGVDAVTRMPSDGFSMSGYTFSGWNTAANGSGTGYAKNATETFNANTTLYAVYTKDIGLDNQGGSGTTSFTATYNKTPDSITPPTRSNYTFGGYYTAAGGGGNQLIAANGSFSAAWTQSGSVDTLYAKWTRSVSLNGYSSYGGSQNVTLVWNASSQTAITAPTRTGYTLDGYYTQDGTSSWGTKIYNTDGSSAGNTWDYDTGTLYAKWVPNVYEITLNNNSATSAGTTAIYEKYDTGYYKEAGCSNAYATSGDSAKITIPTKTGYRFDGYYTGTGAGGVWGTQILTSTGHLAADNLASTFSAAGTINAKWSLITYDLTYELDGGSVASANPETYNVTSSAITLNNPTKTGYTFTGWSGTGLVGSANKTVTISAGSTGNRSYTAHWSANSYTVTLDRQSGTTGSTSVTATFGSNMPSATMPSRTGYNFRGYFASTGGSGTKYYNADGTSNHTWDVASATTIYAYWEAKQSTLVFDRNGATGTLPTTVDGAKATYGQTVPAINAGSLTFENYTFQGWEDSGGTLIYTSASTSTFVWNKEAASVTLYARWSRTITLDKQSGSGGTNNITVYYNKAVSTPIAVAPTRSYYDFAGYWTGPGKTGTQVYLYDRSSNTSASANIWTYSTGSLYAGWTPINYTISYTLNGGTVSPANVTSYNVETASFTLVNPTKSGWTFAGWTGTDLDSATTTVTIAVGNHGNRSYTATWSENVFSTGDILYFAPSAKWQTDGARFAVYFWEDGESGHNTWADMTLVKNVDPWTGAESNVSGYYQVAIPALTNGATKWNRIIIARMNPNNPENSFSESGDNHPFWNKTEDLTRDSDKVNAFVMTAASDSWSNTGQWRRNVNIVGVPFIDGVALSSDYYVTMSASAAASRYTSNTSRNYTIGNATAKDYLGIAYDATMYHVTAYKVNDSLVYYTDAACTSAFTSGNVVPFDNGTGDCNLYIKYNITSYTVFLIDAIHAADNTSYTNRWSDIWLGGTTDGSGSVTFYKISDEDALFMPHVYRYATTWSDFALTNYVGRNPGQKGSNNKNWTQSISLTGATDVLYIYPNGSGWHSTVWCSGTKTTTSGTATIKIYNDSTGALVDSVPMYAGDPNSNIFIYEEGDEIAAGMRIEIVVANSSQVAAGTYARSAYFTDGDNPYPTSYLVDNNSKIVTKVAGRYNFYVFKIGGTPKISIADVPMLGNGFYIMPSDGTYSKGFSDGVKMNTVSAVSATYEGYKVTSQNNKIFIRSYMNAQDRLYDHTMFDLSNVSDKASFLSGDGKDPDVLVFSVSGTYSFALSYDVENETFKIVVTVSNLSQFFMLNGLNADSGLGVKDQHTSVVLKVEFTLANVAPMDVYLVATFNRLVDYVGVNFYVSTTDYKMDSYGEMRNNHYTLYNDNDNLLENCTNRVAGHNDVQTYYGYILIDYLSTTRPTGGADLDRVGFTIVAEQA